jgi:hypothetical protein
LDWKLPPIKKMSFGHALSILAEAVQSYNKLRDIQIGPYDPSYAPSWQLPVQNPLLAKESFHIERLLFLENVINCPPQLMGKNSQRLSFIVFPGHLCQCSGQVKTDTKSSHF